MGELKYRNDNKKLLIWVYIIFVALIIMSLVINVINTKNVTNMYIVFFVFTGAILLYSIFYLIFIHINKAPLQLEDNYLAFYVSFNKHNKVLKKSMVLVDILQLLIFIGAVNFYLIKMDFAEEYGMYVLFAMAILIILNAYTLIKDVIKLNSLDRIDAHTSSHQFNMIDKKLLFAATLLIIALANIGILSPKRAHFVVYYTDMIFFEILVTALLITSLLDVFINKVYYQSFELKQIEQKEFDTRYLEPIGEGEYAKVYKAYMSSLDTVYAVKKLESKNVSDIERFKAEFNIMKALNHPNLLRVYSFDELHYEYTMDYCKYSLRDYIYTHNLTREEKNDLIFQLLNAFEYLHNHGIMHRDVSYRNIMIYESPAKEITLKVMDFGIAKNSLEKKTRKGTSIKGTLIDPALEKFEKYNEQNDIYGLGSIISFILYKDESIKIDDSKESKIINKCMDLNLANRYHYVSEIINDYKGVASS